MSILKFIIPKKIFNNIDIRKYIVKHHKYFNLKCIFFLLYIYMNTCYINNIKI